MQSSYANGPNPVLTDDDDDSLQAVAIYPSLSLHGFAADSLFRQTQNAPMAEFPSPFLHDEFWNGGTHQDILAIPLSLYSPKPATAAAVHTNLATFDNMNYNYHHASCSSSSNSDAAAPQSSLSGSKYLPAMQEILAEIACFTLQNFDQMSYSLRQSQHNNLSQDSRDAQSKKKHLMSLLQLVDDQHSQFLDEIHTVVSAFHAVTELDPNLHAHFALPTLSLMYKNLREKISCHILAVGPNFTEHEIPQPDEKQWALLKKKDYHQLWKPQRGLPERSVSVLRQWMYQNFLHPYPKDTEKHLLALKSGLTRSQVSNWFINARVRLWKPMIEEMYAEMSRRNEKK
ncbi:homeobox protein ATH1 [Andrographis paniculata]|uniref:homeobox protein ATH1 n=1 Tax=Andrographis paniculata TaxID=175694 RepID=UPI0021E9AAD8|nr:homeobox protein ATH1 [Andrographis paniculata]XP_051151424.1 homeobox protein ATH1 [Andrographis paniculata]